MPIMAWLLAKFLVVWSVQDDSISVVKIIYSELQKVFEKLQRSKFEMAATGSFYIITSNVCVTTGFQRLQQNTKSNIVFSYTRIPDSRMVWTLVDRKKKSIHEYDQSSSNTDL